MIRSLLFTVMTILLAADLFAQPECFNCPAGTRVSMDAPSGAFYPDDNGLYSYIPNDSCNGSSFAVQVTLANGAAVRKRIPMGDPTVLTIPGDPYVYVTGTSDATVAETSSGSGFYSNSNFAIYKSTDFYNWVPHMLAIYDNCQDSPTSTCVGSAREDDLSSYWNRVMRGGPTEAFSTVGSPSIRPTLSLHGRSFWQLGAPQLVYDPSQPSTIWLYFNAIELPLVHRCGFPNDTPQSRPMIFAASIDKTQFQSPISQGSQVFWFGGPGCEPRNIGYSVANSDLSNECSSATKFDAGDSVPGGPVIPVSPLVSELAADPCAIIDGLPVDGRPVYVNEGFFIRGRGAAPWLTLDPFVYIENDCVPQSAGGGTECNSNWINRCQNEMTTRKWMLYSWWVDLPLNTPDQPQSVFFGTNISTAPMAAPWLMDANGIDGVFGLTTLVTAQNTTTSNSPGVVSAGLPCAGEIMKDGRMGPGGYPWEWDQHGQTCNRGYSVAEAPAAFSRNGRVYFTYSRNNYRGPAYNIRYRFAPTTNSSGVTQGLLAAAGCNNNQENDPVLVQSRERAPVAANAYGPSYGHGEVFRMTSYPPSLQYFLVFHGKARCNSFECPGVGFSGRTIYFKNVFFDDASTPVQGQIKYTPMSDWLRSDVAHSDASNVRGFVVPSTVLEGAQTCDCVDFNNDGLFPDTADIADFLAVFSGGACSTNDCNDLDFNNDFLFPDTLDIAAITSVFSGGPCLQ